MKTIAFIFVPVVFERTEIHVAVEPEDGDEQIVEGAARDEDYPFWTWFIDNPRPNPSK